MNQEPEQSKDHVETIWTRRIFDGRYVGLLILGILFTIVWLATCAALGVVSLAEVETEGGADPWIPTVVPSWVTYGSFILQIIGLVSLAIAGILAGAAFYCRRHRKRLLWLFAWFFAPPVLLLIVWMTIASFFDPP